VNVVAFQVFLDGGLLTPRAVLGNIMLLINAYLLQCRWAPRFAMTGATPLIDDLDDRTGRGSTTTIP
jgi:hypothetical protein